MPLSQPSMTWPVPSVNVNGSPRSHEASNSSPVENAVPTYCIESVSPSLAGGPLPLTMSSFWSVFGGEPAGTVITGFVLVSFRSGFAAVSVLSPEDVWSDEDEPPPPWSLSLSSPPQPAMPAGTDSTSTARRRASRDETIGGGSLPGARGPRQKAVARVGAAQDICHTRA